MSTTANFNMITLEANQNNPEITYNSNLELIDVLLQANCISKTLTTPPGASNGDVYIPATGATGAWAGYTNYIAAYYNGWKFYTPKAGWRIFDKSTSKYIYYNGAIWTDLPISSSFTDTNFEILESSDTTAKLKFDTINIPTGTTVTITIPNSNYIICKQNLSATTNPTTSNDSSQGYSVGSMWINVTADNAYICVDSTVSNAVWKQINNS